jgi:hypothetical protein
MKKITAHDIIMDAFYSSHCRLSTWTLILIMIALANEVNSKHEKQHLQKKTLITLENGTTKRLPSTEQHEPYAAVGREPGKGQARHGKRKHVHSCCRCSEGW